MELLKNLMPKAVLERMEANGVLNLTSDELERAQIDIINRTQGKLTGCDCPKCLNRGYAVKLDDKNRRYSERCRCMDKRESLGRIRRSGLGDLMERYTLNAWETPEPWQARARELALQYADNPDSKWFCMVGSVGCGKSHICTALTGLLIERGFEARYMLWRNVSVRAKAVVNDEAEYRAIVEPLKRVRVLYIDDLFKVGKGGQPTEADVSLAFEILNYRYANSKLLTIISSEKTVDEITDIDEAVGSRIYERSNGYYLRMTGKKNWRLK